MSFDFERGRPAVADDDDACVFLSGLDENIRLRCWKFLQLAPRIFIRAMLAPHHGEDPELGEIRVAPENFFYAFELIGLESMLGNQLGSDNGIGRNSHALRTLANVARHSTRETFSAHSRDRIFVEYARFDGCLN